MKKMYYISNIGEAEAIIHKELTDEEYKLLKSVFDELNCEDNREPYAPFIDICQE